MLTTTCPVCKQDSLTHDDIYVFCTNCDAYRTRMHFFRRVLAWASHRSPWWRLPLLGLFAYFLWQNWQDPSFAVDRLANPFSALDFGLHELGHYLFIPFGELMRIAGGSIFQCIVPLIALAGFIQIRWYFAAALCFCWLGLNFFDVATYAADAQARTLPLAMGFAGLAETHNDALYDQGHDWYQLLSRTGNLAHDQAIASLLRGAGTAVTFVGLGLGLALAIYMLACQLRRYRTRRAPDA